MVDTVTLDKDKATNSASDTNRPKTVLLPKKTVVEAVVQVSECL